MPIDPELLAGVTTEEAKPPTSAEKREAFNDGANAFREGKTKNTFPRRYRPQMGNSQLFDAWMQGYGAAEIAENGPKK